MSISAIDASTLEVEPSCADPVEVPRGVTVSWRPWRSRGWPCSAIEERRFVAELAELADGSSVEWSRRHVTAVVNALRCGLSVAELGSAAPGLDPGALLAAHRDLDVRRRRAERAWWGLVTDPTPNGLEVHGAAAATLLPVVVGRLVGIALRDPDVLADALAAELSAVEHTARLARTVEEWVATASPETAVRTASLLIDPDGPAVWSDDRFLPPRVGSLVPTRVAALLGERPSAPVWAARHD